MKKALPFIGFLILVIPIILGVYGYFWYNSAISQPNGESTEEVEFEIVSGQGVEEIADNLAAAGLLENPSAFVLYNKLNPDLSSGIQAGYFDIAPSNSIEEILVILQKARTQEDIKVSIPEGLRYDEIAEILATEFSKVEGGFFSKTEFLSIVESPDSSPFNEPTAGYLNSYKPQGENLEGFLYPDTYFFDMHATSIEVIEKMINTLFQDRLTSEDLSAISSSDYSLYEILNIAAMLERETFTDEEKPVVADIIYKRLEEGVDGVNLLQIDATLLYIEKDWKADAFSLKNSDSPYNTYRFVGLPPTPIANPGIASIQAAIYPEANDYFYYIHDNDGVIHYAKTLSEHNQNVAKYL